MRLATPTAEEAQVQFPRQHFYCLLVVSAISSWVVFYGIIVLDVSTDIQLHSAFLKRFLESDQFPIPPLYYALIYLLSGLSTQVAALNNAAVFLLAAAVAAKYWMTAKHSLQYMDQPYGKTILVIGCFLLLFSAPVFYDVWDKRMYLGRIATNVWHNSTTILCMPFVVAQFFTSLRFLQQKLSGLQFFTRATAYGVAILLIKPSFLFAHLPMFLIFTVWLHRGNRSMLVPALAHVALIGLGLLTQYFIIYQTGMMNTIYRNDTSAIAIELFAFWKTHSRSIPADVMVSVAYPITALILFRGELLKRLYFKYCGLLFLCAYAISVVFVETGARKLHGNLVWQAMMCNYLLFLTVLIFNVEMLMKFGLKHRRVIFLSLMFVLHVLSGLLYLFKILYFKGYY